MAAGQSLSREQSWPALPLAEWRDTCDTLHMWTQIAGKIRLALCPHVNHWWEVPLYVSARGLTTSAIPCSLGNFEIHFDFIEHKLDVVAAWASPAGIRLYARSVADFYGELMRTLESLGIGVKIWPMPQEVPNPIRFDLDSTHASYDPVYANRFWRVLSSIDAALKEFRTRFIGKVSPVHFFWGSFDLAFTMFSGRRAPERPGVDRVTREAYSHEEVSVGWWPGSGDVADANFYGYAAPEPAGFREAPVKPEKAFYDAKLGEFLLSYDQVRRSSDPREQILSFADSVYSAGATLGKWDRAAIERSG
ncbi:MAG TPA: DUF5996 family protein [Candidatus Acidoferrales bacterium]|nr:DUF5996 family protein [Candidatus Acidoferrales bacterium]